jgi:hypothetical protein
VHRRHAAVCQVFEHREVQQLGVEVQDIELVGGLAHLVKHAQMRGEV